MARSAYRVSFNLLGGFDVDFNRRTWARIDSMTDEEIDTSICHHWTMRLSRALEWRMPEKKTAVTLSVDDDVLKWFEAQGAEFQNRVNAALRIYAEAHQE